MHTLLHSLQDYPLAMLRAIAEVRGLTLQSNVAREVVQQLADQLADPDNLLAALAGCSAQARQALDAVLRGGGHLPAAAFERRFGEIRRFGPGRLEREAPQRAPANPAEELWYRGLIFRSFAQTAAGPLEVIYVPNDLLALLPEPSPLSASFELPAVPPPDRPVSANADLLHDFCTLLALVQTGSVRLTRPDDPLAWRASSLKTLNDWLLRPADDAHSLIDAEAGEPGALLLVLAAELGWLRGYNYRLKLQAGQVRTWLEAPRAQQRRILLEAWQHSARWNDLCRTPALRCEQTGSWSNDPVETRRQLLPVLASLTAGIWYRVDDLVALVKEHLPDFQRPDGDYDTWYVRQRGEQRFLRGFECWDQVEGELLRFLIGGPLYWLGAVCLDPEASGANSAVATTFTLSPAGAAWLQEAEPPEEPCQGCIQVMADFSVLVPADVPLLERFRVTRFTTWLDKGPPFRYRITQSGLRWAASQGISAERVLHYLREQVGADLPGNVAAALARWQA